MDFPWSGWEQPTVTYCEENLFAWIRQPANTWSNLAYIAVGVVILIHFGLKVKHGKSWLLGPIAIFAGICSFLYHASYTFFFQFIDLASMFLYTAFLLANNITRLSSRPRQFYPLLFTICTLFTVLLFLLRGKWGWILFVSQLVAFLCLELLIYIKKRPSIRYRFLFLSLGSYLFSLIFWTMDLMRVWCYPQNHLINGHAIWHLFGFPSFLFIYLFFRSVEKVETQ